MKQKDEKLLLTPEERSGIYHQTNISSWHDASEALKRLCQAQLNKVQQKQSEALQDFTENKISFERLAERLNINFYELHAAFEKYKGTGRRRCCA